MTKLYGVTCHHLCHCLCHHQLWLNRNIFCYIFSIFNERNPGKCMLLLLLCCNQFMIGTIIMQTMSTSSITVLVSNRFTFMSMFTSTITIVTSNMFIFTSSITIFMSKSKSTPASFFTSSVTNGRTPTPTTSSSSTRWWRRRRTTSTSNKLRLLLLWPSRPTRSYLLPL